MTNQKLRFISFGAAFLATLLLFSSIFRAIEPYPLLISDVSKEAEQSETVIVLDAGHGGEDGGATGTNGVLEKDLNLQIARDLAALLRLAGYEVVETRTEDQLLCEPETKKGHRKQRDLENRLAVTAQYENCILVSIHMNTFPNQSCEGTQVWYSQSNEASAELARAVQERVKAVLQPQNHRKIKAATSGIYLLRHAEIPAILVECGFLSTPAECERLCDPAYQSALVTVLFSSISEKVTAQS